MDALTDRDRKVLDFEDRQYRSAGAKEEAIRSAFGLSPARHFQIVNALIDMPAALEAKPLLVHRLLRERERRTTARQSRSFTGSATPSATPSR